MFGFVKRIFVSIMTLFDCNLLSVNPLESFSMKLLILIVTRMYFILLVLKQVNAEVVVTTSMIPM